MWTDFLPSLKCCNSEMYISIIRGLYFFNKIYRVPCDDLKDLVLHIFGMFCPLFVHSYEHLFYYSLMEHSNQRETKDCFDLWLNQSSSRPSFSAFHTNGETSTADFCLL